MKTTKIKVELVIHCWKFSLALRYLLESLMQHPPQRVEAVATVCYSGDDDGTVQTMIEYTDPDVHPWPHRVYISPYQMETEELLNRSIGRNKRALNTPAALVWFMDCDYWLGAGCLDALAGVPLHPEEPGYSPLYFPRVVMISKDHATGDAYTDRVGMGGVAKIDPDDFIPKHERKAIGGTQIMPGDVARLAGYAADYTRYLHPVRDGKWQTTRGDVIIRRVLGTNGLPIDLPNCYRIRQSVEGVCDARKAQQ